MEKAEYLGDGLYAEWNGLQVVLKANDYLNPTDEVYLEHDVVMSLFRYLRKIGFEFEPEE